MAALPVPARLVPDVRRIAVLRANGLGDFVLALPALEALRAAYPAARITLLGAPWHAELLSGRPGPWDQVEVVPPCPGVREGEAGDPAELEAFFARQRERGYDLAVQLHGGGGHSNPFVRHLGAGLAVGSRDRGAPPLDRTVAYAHYQHETIRYLEVVGLAGAAPVRLEPELAVTPADRNAAAAVLPDDDQPLVLIHPGATDPRRRWPAPAFAAVGDALADTGARVAVVGSADEAELGAEVAGRMARPAADLTGALSLSAMVGLAERAVVLVGNDSGPRHLAGAVGTATASVYWCGNLINAGPLTRRRHRVAVSLRTRCPVCGRDQDGGRCPHDPSFVADVAVEEVRRHALDLLREGAQPRGAAA